MNLQEAREELKLMSNLDLDLYKGVVLDGDGNMVEEADGLTSLISGASQDWQKWTLCSYDPSVSLTLTVSDGIYDLRSESVVSTPILKPRSVMINSTMLYRPDGKEYGLWTMGDLMRRRPNWRDMTDAAPTAAVWYQNRYLLLSAAPDAIYAGTNFIEGWTIIAPLVSGTDDDVELPGLPEDHIYIVQRAMVQGSRYTASEPAARQRLADVDQSYREAAHRRKQENLAGFVGRNPRGSRAYSDWMT